MKYTMLNEMSTDFLTKHIDEELSNLTDMKQESARFKALMNNSTSMSNKETLKSISRDLSVIKYTKEQIKNKLNKL